MVTVWDTINEPRYPSFKGIMAAKKKPVQTLSLADLGIAADEVGFAGATERGGRAQQAPAASGRHQGHRRGRRAACKLVEFLAVREVRLRGADHG